MKPFRTMLKTELKLSLRGMDMVIFAICMPLVVFVILGVIYGDAPAFDGAGYTFLEQSFGGLTTISLCAGGLMGLPLVLSDYRSKKILKRFQVTPVSPGLILLVQVVIYTLYALSSFLVLSLVGKAVWGVGLHGSPVLFLGGYLLVLLSLFSLGIMVGGIAPNAKIASVIASILYFPMLLFSGATLPYEIMPAALQRAADLLPLTQGVKLLKAASLGLPIQSVLPSLVVTAAIAACCTVIALKFFRWE